MKNFNIGDHVLFGDHKVEIIEIYLNQFYIRFLDQLTVNNEQVLRWTFLDDIKPDKQWYREEKLKELGI